MAVWSVFGLVALIARPALAENEGKDPFIVAVSYIGELDSAVTGGNAQGSRYLDNIDVSIEADLEGLVGWQGAKAYVSGLYNNGTSFSPLVGDAFVISNIETGVRAG